ncbi:MAG: class I SAM-dependent methyltransferase [Pseudomonadota bacterium]
MTRTAQANSSFWDRRADSYAAKPINDVPAYEKTLERVHTWLSPEMRALELGCGTGATAIKLAPHVAHLTASDISKRMIEIAQTKPEAAALPNLEFVQARLEDIEKPPGSFDVILGFNYLHLLRDLQGMLARSHGLLKPGGLLITKTPSAGAVSWALRAAIPLMQLVGLAPYVALRHGDQLEAIITDAGFEILETGEYPKHSRFIVAKRI